MIQSRKFTPFILLHGGRNHVGVLARTHQHTLINRGTLDCPLKQSRGFIKIVDLDWSNVICHLEVPHQSCKEHHLLLQGKLDVLGLLQENAYQL